MRASGVFVPAAALLATGAYAESNLETRQQCYAGLYIIAARGTSEIQGQSKLETIIGPLKSQVPNSASNEVVYPADNDFYPSVKAGVENAQQQIQDYAAACPDSRMVTFGYSQGALVMSIALAGGSANGTTFDPISQDIGKNIVSVIQFGDSSRVLGQGTAAEGSGACQTTSPLMRTGNAVTAMNFYADRLQDWCKAADPICCKTGTDIQAHLSYWTAADTSAADQFVESHDSGNYSSSGSSSSASAESSTTEVGAAVTPGGLTSVLPSATSAAASATGSATSHGTTTASHSTTTTSHSTTTASTTSTAASGSEASATPTGGAASMTSRSTLVVSVLSSCFIFLGLSIAV